jgi:hypothetical protein
MLSILSTILPQRDVASSPSAASSLATTSTPDRRLRGGLAASERRCYSRAC